MTDFDPDKPVELLNLNQLLDLKIPEPKRIWGPCFTTNNICMIWGPTGVGKTYVCLKLAMTIAAGGRWLQYEVTKPRRVAYIDGEMGHLGMRRRLGTILAEAPLAPRGDFFKILSKEQCGGELWNIADPNNWERYERLFEGCDVIFFDNLLSCMFERGNWDSDARQIQTVRPWLTKLREAGKLIVLVHHANKSGQQIGTSLKENWLDTNVELRRPTSPRQIAGTEFEWRWNKRRDVVPTEALDMNVSYIRDEDGVSRWAWSPIMGF